MAEIGFDFKNLSVELVEQYLGEVKEEITNTLDNIASFEGTRTFENTVRPIINVYTLVEPKQNCFHFASNFYPTKEIRDIGSKVGGELNKFLIDCEQRKDVYHAFKNYEKNLFQREKYILTKEECRYVEHAMRDFYRSGLHLDDEELVQMKKELSDMGVQYDKNLNEENTSFEFNKIELDGMPESWFNEEKLVDKENQTYKVTLKYPDYVPAMEYIKNDRVREKIYAAYCSRCAKENVPLFEKTVKLRHQVAQKLGYNTHADYKTQVQIVKTGQNALDFENNLNKLFTPLYEKDMDIVTKFAQKYKTNRLAKHNMDPWDIRFYNRIYKEMVCDIDMEKVKKYFPLNTVRKGLFEIYQLLLGLKFTEVDTDNKWHENTQLFSVNDTVTDELMGYFYLDMYPREGKYAHAAVFDFISGCDMSKITGGGRRPHVMAMACNFPESGDGCISFNDVETFFHEFGHLMHQICSRPQLADFVGLDVERDFVEAPSQMLEFWCYCKEPLQMMSGHKDTGEPIPEEMINKIKQTKKVLGGYRNKRQLMFGLFDLKVHMMKFDDSVSFDSQKIWYETEKEVLNIESPVRYNPVASFGHIMGGYDAGYYGYLRSETYAANMFYTVFKDGHVLDPEAGQRYRKKLLEPGSTRDGLELLEDFLGEEPDDSYFLIEYGLETASTS